MTEQEAKQNINNTVYGFLDEGTNVIIEELTLVSIDKQKKHTSIILKTSIGDLFRSTLPNYYLNKIDALRASKAVLDASIKATQREIEYQTKTLNSLMLNRQKLEKTIIKESRLATIRK